MKKTLIYATPFRWKARDRRYIPDYSTDAYSGEKVLFPMDGIIKAEITEEDDVDVIFVQTLDDNEDEEKRKDTDEFVERGTNEISALFEGACHSLSFSVIQVRFHSTSADIINLYKEVCGRIAENSVCYADVTFGEKYIMMLIFCALNYAEKYLGCEVAQLLYGRFDGDNEKDACLIEFTPLYLLNSLGQMFDGPRKNFDSLVDNLIGK